MKSRKVNKEVVSSTSSTSSHSSSHPTTTTRQNSSFDDVNQLSKKRQEDRQYPTESEERQSSRLAQIFENIVWLVLGALSLWHSDIIALTLQQPSPSIRWPLLYGGLVAASVFIGIFLYMNYWLPWRYPQAFRPNELAANWKILAPKAIPLATIAGLVFVACSLAAYFPLFGWLTFAYFYSFALCTVTIISFFG